MKIERLLANNPGPYTGPGTNTWLLDDGAGSVVVIDPGPVDPDHRRAIEDAAGERRVEAVLVTHTHLDHAPLANPLARYLEVPAIGHAAGPEFDPDRLLADGDRLQIGTLTLSVVHTPGHADDHLCFRAGNVLFSGDHIIGGSSVMVEDMAAYLASLRRLAGTGIGTIHPGHGETIEEADEVIEWYLAHRLQRHREILDAVARGADSVEAIVGDVYAEVDSALHPLAARSVRAHLALLSDEGRIALEGDSIQLRPPQTT